ncbi:MAG: DUF1614 domain-containing protein [Euryarchaeota archaeon]|nr:DUF1614 domain-containing protein [Euryarchaeota archaeon]
MPPALVAYHADAGAVTLTLLGVALAILVFYYVIGWVRKNLGKLGLTQGEIAFILWGTFLGGFINIPLVPFGEGWLAINVGGAVVPILLSLYLIQKKRLPMNELLVGIVLVTVVSYLVTDYVPGVGVLSPFPLWLLPAVAAFAVAASAYWHERDDAASLAYVSGTLGTLIGADILRLPEILSGPKPEAGQVLSIGGGAIFDMVFLTGIIAIALETGLLTKRRQRLSRGGRGNPIDDEFDAWLRAKEADAARIERRHERHPKAAGRIEQGRSPAGRSPTQPRR